MELNEFLDRLDEVTLSKLLDWAKQKRVDFEDSSANWVGQAGVVDQTGKRLSPDEVIVALANAKIPLSDKAKMNIRNATKDVSGEAERVAIQDKKQQALAAAEKQRKLRQVAPSELRAAWNK